MANIKISQGNDVNIFMSRICNIKCLFSNAEFTMELCRFCIDWFNVKKMTFDDFSFRSIAKQILLLNDARKISLLSVKLIR